VLDSLGSAIIGSLRIVSGRLLSTFGHRTQDESLSLHTPTATVGIRGTGVYAEGYHDRSYVCTCYGHTRISANSDPEVSRDVVTTHHNAPKYILRDAPADQLIEPAPVIHHTDMEILLITALVGRTPPFAVSGSGYGAPRKISY